MATLIDIKFSASGGRPLRHYVPDPRRERSGSISLPAGPQCRGLRARVSDCFSTEDPGSDFPSECTTRVRARGVKKKKACMRVVSSFGAETHVMLPPSHLQLSWPEASRPHLLFSEPSPFAQPRSDSLFDTAAAVWHIQELASSQRRACAIHTSRPAVTASMTFPPAVLREQGKVKTTKRHRTCRARLASENLEAASRLL